jgi:hypothetical protein
MSHLSIRQYLRTQTDTLTPEEEEAKIKADAANRARLLRESKIAAKKRLEEKAKASEEKKLKEKMLQEKRLAAKEKFSKVHVAEEVEGFFSLHAASPIHLQTKPVTSSTVEVVVEEVEPEIVEAIAPVPTLSAEEIIALRIEKERQLRAQALAESKAQARARFGKTPKGKLAALKAAASPKRVKDAADSSTEPVAGGGTDFIASDGVDEVVPLRELTKEEIAKISEEASYASVDAAWAASKAFESKDLFSRLEEISFNGRKAMYSIGQIVDSKIAANQSNDEILQKYQQAVDTTKSLAESMFLATDYLQDASNSANTAEESSRAITGAKSLDEAMAFVVQASDSAEKVFLSAASLKNLEESITSCVDTLLKIESELKVISG